MYNLRSSNKDTVQFPVQIEIADDNRIFTDLLHHKATSLSTEANMSDSYEASDSDIDCDALIQHSDEEIQSTSLGVNNQSKQSRGSNLEPTDVVSDLQVQSVINSQILQQLQQIGKRLDKIEGDACKKTSDKAKIKKTKVKQQQVVNTTVKQQPKTFDDLKLPTLQSVKEDALIQLKVEQRLQELTDLAKTGMNPKLKSQRGGTVEVMVKNRIKWPHEYILSGLSKERVTYDQLSVTQWVAGFGRTMRDESDPEIRKHMLDYMISLMDDANDFSWISAKASHAVLLCRMEQGEVASYADISAIDRIRRANAQKHVPHSQVSPQKFNNGKKFTKITKTMPCTYFNQGTCLQKKSHETRGVLYKHICASCFASAGKTFPHSEVECKNKQKGSKNE